MVSADKGFAFRFARTATEIYLLLMLAVFPVFTGFRGYSNITFSKYAFFTSLSLIWFLTLIVAGTAGLISGRARIASPRVLLKSVKACDWAIILFLTASCLSALFSPYRKYVFIGAGRYEGLASLLLYGGVFLCLSRLANPGRRHFLSLGASVTVCCAISIAQLWGYNPLGLFPEGYGYYDAHILYTGEFLGTIGNTNLLSGFFCIAIPLFAAAFITGSTCIDILYLVPCVLGVFVLAASGVSGGIVALGVCSAVSTPVLLRNRPRLYRAFTVFGLLSLSAGIAMSLSPDYSPDYGAGPLIMRLSPAISAVVLFLLAAVSICFSVFMYARKPRNPLSPRKLSVFFALTIAALALGIFFLAMFWPFGDDGAFYEFSRILRGDIRDEFGSSRIRIWRESLALFPERPLLGGGPDTLPRRIDIEFSRYVPQTGKTLRSFVDNAHNEYIGYLVNLGLLGLLPYLAAIFITAVQWFRNKDAIGFAPALGCALICYWVQGLFGLGLCITAPFMWICWGLFRNAVPEEVSIQVN